MATKSTPGTKATGTRSRKTSTKQPTAQPIPIDTPISSTGTTSTKVSPDSTPATQAYPGIEEEIRRRAYELYEQRGRHDGLHDEDWRRAETEVLAKYQKKEKSA
jgi:DUF2934 family protein